MTARILSSVKDVFKHEKIDNEPSDPETEPQRPPLVRDGATMPVTLDDAPDTSTSTKLRGEGARSQTVTTLEDYPLGPADTTTSGAIAEVHDAQAELANARIVERVEPEEDEDEGALSDIQLRRLYDDEEIERFLTVFASHVNEITLAPTEDHQPRNIRIMRSRFKDGRPGDIQLIPIDDETVLDAEDNIDEPLTNPSQNKISDSSTGVGSSISKTPTKSPVPRYLSAHVAAFLTATLPPAPVAPPSEFKIGAAQLAGQRMYTSTYPFYAPFLMDLLALAAWTDWHHSARVCAVWWILWWFNMLLPGLFGKIFLSLLRRGMSPNPTLRELRRRRRAAAEAVEFGGVMEADAAAASFFGTGSIPGIGQGGGEMTVREMMKLAKLLTKEKGKKVKGAAKRTTHAVAVKVGAEAEGKEQNSSSEDADWRRTTVKAMEGIADFHERVRNLFIWRCDRPSRIYTFILGLLTLFLALTPARVLAKLFFGAVGFFFWFVVPVILAMPFDTIKRIPAPLSNVPSDTEYVTALIGKRLARGESIIPTSRHTRQQRSRATQHIAGLNPTVQDAQGDITRAQPVWATEAGYKQSVHDMRQEANEKEAVAAEERATARGENENLASEDVGAQENTKSNTGPMDRLKHRWEDVKADLMGHHDDPDESLQNFGAPKIVSAIHEATPGSLTLNSEAITFTSISKDSPRRVIPLDRVQGVKKTGHTSGLRIRYKDEENEEQEIVFRFISNRDEIFGTLVGWGAKRWTNA